MSANTTRKGSSEDLWELFEKFRKFWLMSVWPLIQNGKRSGQDLWDMLQVFKDRPEVWRLHVGVLLGTHHIVPLTATATFRVDTAEAFKPENWKHAESKVRVHRSIGVVDVGFVDGEMFIDGRRVIDYAPTESVSVDDVQKELVSKSTLPANILGLLIENQDNLAVKLFLLRYDGRRPCFLSSTYEHYSSRGIGVRGLNRDSINGRLTWWEYPLSTVLSNPEAYPILILEEEKRAV